MRRGMILIVLLLLVKNVSGQMYQWTDDQGRVHFSDKPPAGSTVNTADEAENQKEDSSYKDDTPRNQLPSNQSLTSLVEALTDVTFIEPGYSDTLMLRHSFNREDFEVLNSELDKRLRALQKDISQETRLRSAYNLYADHSDATLGVYNRWVEAYPDDYQPYLARAYFRYARGWQARGNEFSVNTTRDQFSQMEREFAFALDDLGQAIKKNKMALPAYYLQILIAIPSSNPELALTGLQAATHYHPNTYLARDYFSGILDRRWGGSDELLQAFSEKVDYSVSENPMLASLVAMPIYEKGYREYRSKNYQASLALFNQALDKGPSASTYYFRGRSYYWLEKYSDAVEDFNRALYLNPEEGAYFYWRSKALYYGGHFSPALNDIKRAYALRPTDKNIIKFRKKLFARLAHPDLAKVDKQWAQETSLQEPSKYNEKLLYETAMACLAAGKNQKAEALLVHLISLQPDKIEYFRWLDFALFRQAKLDEIIPYWNDFIARNPLSSEAYIERTGTYYQLEDYPVAIIDARKALNLGDEGARDIYQRLQVLTGERRNN